MSKKTYFITGGGTGGHIYPAIAVADALIDKDDTTVYYVGNPHNIEHSIAVNKGYNFLPVHVSGMPRKPNLKFVLWGFQLLFAIIKCVYYLCKYNPDMVFGTGGYVSAPVLIASNIKKTPYMLHDCDIQPGLVTRKLSTKAKCVSLAFEKAKYFIKNRNCYINGNPLRPDFFALSKEDAKKKLGLSKDKIVLCVMGGSQGSKSIDRAFVEIIKELSTIHDFQIIFQTGENNYQPVIDRLSKIYKDFQSDKNLTIKPYFDDMITVVKASDIVIARAGSLSLSEIFASSCAPILIPYPFAAADHQRKNAKYVLDNNACIYIEDADAEPNLLLKTLLELKNNPEKIEELMTNSSKLAKPDALDEIIDQIEKVAQF